MLGGLCYERRSSETTPRISDPAVDLHQKYITFAPSLGSGSPKEEELESNNNNDEEHPNYEYSEKNIVILKKGNRYEYLDTPSSCIGHGSFGIVFKGNNKTNGQKVAIKKMSSINVRPDELKTMQRVQNKHLVALIDICDNLDGLVYLIMELCDTDLDRHLKWSPTGKLTSIDLRTVMDNIARGYYALFKHRVVHRDIKPQNILLKYNKMNGYIETAKITDFGVSRMLSDQQNDVCSNVAGTFYYMAPEVGANLLTTCAYGSSVDMWSIGCVFYQCLVGEMPFDECSLCRLFLNCAGGNYDAYDMPDLPEHTDEELRQLITTLLEIDREKRATPLDLYTSVVGPSSGWEIDASRLVRDQ